MRSHTARPCSKSTKKIEPGPKNGPPLALARTKNRAGLWIGFPPDPPSATNQTVQNERSAPTLKLVPRTDALRLSGRLQAHVPAGGQKHLTPTVTEKKPILLGVTFPWLGRKGVRLRLTRTAAFGGEMVTAKAVDFTPTPYCVCREQFFVNKKT